MSLITPARGKWTPPTRAASGSVRQDAARHVHHHEVASRRGLFALGIALSLAIPLALSALVFGSWIEWAPDGFHYLALARHLLENGHFPAERITTPPGFPLLLSPLLSADDLPIVGIRVLLAGAFISTGVLAFLLFRPLIGEGWAMIAAALTGLSATLLAQSTSLLSESVYLPMSLLALVILTRWGRSGPEGFADLMSGGLAVAGAWAIRSTGLLLVPVAVWTAFRGGSGGLGARFGRATLVALISLGPILAWEARQSEYPARHGYLDSLLQPRAAAGENAAGLALQQARLARFGPQRMSDLAAAVIPPHVGWRFLSGPWAFSAACVVTAAILVAAFHGLIRHRRPADAYLILYLALLAVWPWNEGSRLMTPLVPICVGYAACAGRRLWESRGWVGRIAKPTSVAFAVLVLGIMAWEQGLTVTSLRDRQTVSQRRLSDMHALGNWLEQNVTADAKVSAVVPAGSAAKLSVLGGRYFARCDMQIEHGAADGQPITAANGANWRIVHRSLLGQLSWSERGFGRTTLGEFVAIKMSP